MASFNPAAELQDQLTSRWTLACKVLDKGEPLSDRFKESLEDYHQLMERFDAVEASLRRSGMMLCIRDEGTCEGQVVSCRACAPRVEGQSPVTGSNLGRSKSGEMWLIEDLSF